MSLLNPIPPPSGVERVWSWVLYQIEEAVMVGIDVLIAIYLGLSWVIEQIRKA